MLTVITATWIGSTGEAGHAMLDSKVPHRRAIHARSELGMVQINLTGGDSISARRGRPDGYHKPGL